MTEYRVTISDPDELGNRVFGESLQEHLGEDMADVFGVDQNVLGVSWEGTPAEFREALKSWEDFGDILVVHKVQVDKFPL